MATRYDHPNVIVRREFNMHVLAATVNLQYFRTFQLAKLYGVHGAVLIAGTGANTTSGIRIDLVGTSTTSIGNIDFSTNTIAHTTSVVYTGGTQTMIAGGGINIVKRTEATGVFNVVLEYEVLPDAAQT